MTRILFVCGLILGAAIGVLVYIAHQEPNLSASSSTTTYTNPQIFTNTVKIGTSASTRSTVTGLQFGTCALIVNGAISATSTRNFDCAVTGVTSSDTVFAMSRASSTPAQGGVNVTGASASTTAGYITFTVVNLTGASYNPATTGFGSSTQYLIIR